MAVMTITKFPGYKNSKIVVLPVPYDSTVSYRTGCRQGPRAIINSINNLEYFDLELEKEIHHIGITILNDLVPDVRGPYHMINKVQTKVRSLLEKGKFVVMLGGEHSLTVGSVRAHEKFFPEFSVLSFDAHADLRDSFEGSKYSHACVMRRLWKKHPVVITGLRSLSSPEFAFIKSNNIRIFPAHEYHEGKFALDDLLEGLGNRVYITVDLDVFDPSQMPAVGTPEPGGLLWYDILAILRAVCRRKTVIGFDIVELAPIPGLVSPEFLALKLMYKMLGYIFLAGSE